MGNVVALWRVLAIIAETVSDSTAVLSGEATGGARAANPNSAPDSTEAGAITSNGALHIGGGGRAICHGRLRQCDHQRYCGTRREAGRLDLYLLQRLTTNFDRRVDFAVSGSDGDCSGRARSRTQYLLVRCDQQFGWTHL